MSEWLSSLLERLVTLKIPSTRYKIQNTRYKILRCLMCIGPYPDFWSGPQHIVAASMTADQPMFWSKICTKSTKSQKCFLLSMSMTGRSADFWAGPLVGWQQEGKYFPIKYNKLDFKSVFCSSMTEQAHYIAWRQLWQQAGQSVVPRPTHWPSLTII